MSSDNVAVYLLFLCIFGVKVVVEGEAAPRIAPFSVTEVWLVLLCEVDTLFRTVVRKPHTYVRNSSKVLIAVTDVFAVERHVFFRVVLAVTLTTGSIVINYNLVVVSGKAQPNEGCQGYQLRFHSASSVSERLFITCHISTGGTALPIW